MVSSPDSNSNESGAGQNEPSVHQRVPDHKTGTTPKENAGNHSQAETFEFSRWLFLRLLGLCYFCAFFSLATQVIGLFGQSGILPISGYMQVLQAKFGSEAVWLAPSLFWLNSSDQSLIFMCWAGAALSLAILAGFGTTIFLIVLWILYISFLNAGQSFLSFQWDALLLETGFLAIFLSSGEFFSAIYRGKERDKARSRASPIVLALCWWLLFRLMFMSGCVKLLSGDSSWQNLTALNYHFWTQPLPLPPAWYLAKLPETVLQFFTAAMFFIELIVPFFIFMPGLPRLIAALLLIWLQILIALSGNYCFFNLLTIALALLAISDKYWQQIIPQKLFGKITSKDKCQFHWSRKRKIVEICLACLILIASIGPFAQRLFGANPAFQIADALLDKLQPLHLVNSYGLFAVMTKSRPEIIVEGSDDGSTWYEYEFKYKIGDTHRPLPIVAPLQPRLDWQMWFAALSSWYENPWFIKFLQRLTEGEPEVIALLKNNPFPTHPPKYVRALLYKYHFSNFDQAARENIWWTREYIDQYCPVLTKDGFE